jgi:hypothetical protein
MYEPNTSPFGLTFEKWEALEGDQLQRHFLNQFSNIDLDEFRSCAHAELSKPIHEDDERLVNFAHDCTMVLVRRGGSW